MKEESNPYNNLQKDSKENNRIPIKRGCSNKECFCTGKCNEIIGYEDERLKIFNK